MKKESITNGRKVLTASAALAAVASTVSAGGSYLQPVIDFVDQQLTHSIKVIGLSLSVLMFVYGAAKYVYTVDDPGGRKQAMGICVASLIAMIIIYVADIIIMAIIPP